MVIEVIQRKRGGEKKGGKGKRRARMAETGGNYG